MADLACNTDYERFTSVIGDADCIQCVKLVNLCFAPPAAGARNNAAGFRKSAAVGEFRLGR